MGQAPSIEEMQGKEDGFDAWVAKRTKAVVEECKVGRDELLKKFDEDYPKIDDWQTVRDKYFSDFTHDETFTLAAVSEIIHKITGALFGDPDGGGDPNKDASGGVEVTKPQLDPNSIGALAGFGNVEAMIAVKALNLVAGILEVFDTHASLKGTFQGGIDEIAPGLHVGINARRTEYSGEGFFNKTTVKETYFVVVVKYSHKSFMAMQGIFDDAKKAELLAEYRKSYGDKLTTAIVNLDPFDKKGNDLLSQALHSFNETLKTMEEA